MPFVEGYLNTLSAVPGQIVKLHASSDADYCTLRVVREGFIEREVHRHDGRIAIGEHPIPPTEPWVTGPNWPACFEWQVPTGLPSGVYRLELRAHGQRDQKPRFTHWCDRETVHHLMLVVRAAQPASRSRTLLQLSTNTYMAYNMWGGRSTYVYNSFDKIASPVVSLLRPGHGYYGHSGFSRWERPFVHWCEREGIELEYATNYDLETWPDGFDNYRLILSVGHDEYWSSPMRDNLERFITRGGNAAFFSGNSVCWQVRFEDGGTRMVTYKENYKEDPVYKTGPHRLLSTLWSHPLVGRPENQLTGVGFRMGGYHRSHGAHMDGSGAYTVHRPDHWVFRATHLQRGDSFGGADTIVGYECDGCAYEMRDGLPFPTHADGTPEGFTILAQAPALWTAMESDVFQETRVSNDGRATLGLYTRGGTVFTAGTTDWAHGLATDPVVQQITRNVVGQLG